MGTPITRIQLRRGNSNNWSPDTILADGEPAYEPDTSYLRIGIAGVKYEDLPIFIPKPPTPISFTILNGNIVNFDLKLSTITDDLAVDISFVDKTTGTIIQTDEDISTTFISYQMNFSNQLESNRQYFAIVKSTDVSPITLAQSDNILYAPVILNLTSVTSSIANIAWIIDSSFNIDSGLILSSYVNDVLIQSNITYTPLTGQGDAEIDIGSLEHGDTCYLTFTDSSSVLVARTAVVSYNDPGIVLNITNPSQMTVTVKKDTSILSYLNQTINIKLGTEIVHTFSNQAFTTNIRTLTWISSTPLLYGSYQAVSTAMGGSQLLDYTPVILSNLQYIDATHISVDIDYDSGQFGYALANFPYLLSVRSNSTLILDDGSNSEPVESITPPSLTNGTSTHVLNTTSALSSNNYYAVAVFYDGDENTLVNVTTNSNKLLLGTFSITNPTFSYTPTSNTISTTFNLGALGTFPENANPIFTLNNASGVISGTTIEILDGVVPVASGTYLQTNKTYTLNIITSSLLPSGEYFIYKDSTSVKSFDFIPFNLAITNITSAQITATFQGVPDGSTLAITGGASTTVQSTDTTKTLNGTFLVGSSYTATITTPAAFTSQVSKQYVYEGVSLSSFSITNNLLYSIRLQITSAGVTALNGIPGSANYFIRIYDTSAPNTKVNEYTLPNITAYTTAQTISDSLNSYFFQIGRSYNIALTKNDTLVTNITNLAYNPLTVNSFAIRDKTSLSSTITRTGSNISSLQLSVYRSPSTLVARTGLGTSALSFLIPSTSGDFVNNVSSTYILKIETVTGGNVVYTHAVQLSNIIDTQFGGTFTIRDVIVRSPSVSATEPKVDTSGRLYIFLQYSGLTSGIPYPTKVYPFTPTIQVDQLPDIGTTIKPVTYNSSTVTYHKYTSPTYTSGGLLNFDSGSALITDINVDTPKNAGGYSIVRMDLNLSAPPRCGTYDATILGASFKQTFPFYPITFATDFSTATTYVSTFRYLNRKTYYIANLLRNTNTTTFATYPGTTQYVRYVTINSVLYYLLYVAVYIPGGTVMYGQSNELVSGENEFPITTGTFAVNSSYYPALLFNDATGIQTIITNHNSSAFRPEAPVFSPLDIDPSAKTITYIFAYSDIDSVVFDDTFIPKVGISTTVGGTYTFAKPSSAKIKPGTGAQTTLNLTSGYKFLAGTTYTIVLTLSSITTNRFYVVAPFTADDDVQFQQFSSGVVSNCRSAPILYDPPQFTGTLSGVIADTTDLSYSFTLASGGGQLTTVNCLIMNSTQNKGMINTVNLIGSTATFPSSLSSGTYTIILKPSARTPTYSSSTKTFTFGIKSGAPLTNSFFQVSNIYTITLTFTDPYSSLVLSTEIRYSPPGYDIIILAGETNMVGADGESLSSDGKGSLYDDPDPAMRWGQSNHAFLSNLQIVDCGATTPPNPTTNANTTFPMMYNYSFRGPSQANMTTRTVSMGEEFVGYYITYIKETNRNVIVIPAADRRSGFEVDSGEDGLDSWRYSNNWAANNAARARFYLMNTGKIHEIPALRKILESYGTTSTRITRIAAFLWHNGEYDANLNSSTWHAEINDFKGDIDSELESIGTYDYSEYPFIVSQLPQTWALGKSNSRNSSNYINNACSCISTTGILNDTSASSVSSLGLTGILYNTTNGDISSCFSNRSQRLLASRHMNAYLSYAYTAPNETSLPTINSAPFRTFNTTSLPTPTSLSYASQLISWRSCSNSWKQDYNASFYYARITMDNIVYPIIFTEYVSNFSSNQGSPTLTVPLDAPASPRGCWLPGLTLPTATSPPLYNLNGSSFSPSLGSVSTQTGGNIAIPACRVFPVYRFFGTNSPSSLPSTYDTMKFDIVALASQVGEPVDSFSLITLYAISATITGYNGTTFTNSLRASDPVTLNIP
jgi:hypothetical protein